MRKQRRAAELQDKRDRIRMGLVPPDAPKGPFHLCPPMLTLTQLTLRPTVRLSNLMKVLTSDAVQDPTRVEARVRREVAMRKHGHEKMNSERKLTDEQRRDKKEEKKVEEEKRGIVGAVFKYVCKAFRHLLHLLTSLLVQNQNTFRPFPPVQSPQERRAEQPHRRMHL